MRCCNALRFVALLCCDALLRRDALVRCAALLRCNALSLNDFWGSKSFRDSRATTWPVARTMLQKEKV